MTSLREKVDAELAKGEECSIIAIVDHPRNKAIIAILRRVVQELAKLAI